MYAFGPPGWSHDGSTLTVKQLQRSLAKQSQPSAVSHQPVLQPAINPNATIGVE